MKKNFFLLASFFLLLQACVQPVPLHKDELLHSFIDDQWMFEGTYMEFFVHTIHEDLSDVEYTLLNQYDFVHLKSSNGQATIAIEPPLGARGQIPFAIQIKKGDRASNIDFKLDILPRPKNIIHTKEGEINPSLLHNATDSVLILLENDNHIDLNVSNTNNTITYIAPSSGNHAFLNKVEILQSQNINIKGFTINGDNLARPKALIEVDSSSHHITISNCNIGNYVRAETWTESALKEKLSNGIFTYGDSITIINNLIQATYHGIETNGNYNHVGFNIVDRFGGDAIRNTGDNGVFYNNTLKNATIDDYHAPDGNHDDLFQSWTFDQPIKNITLKNNIAVAYADKNLQHYSTIVQGLVCFDGFTENWQIYNNLVLVDHPHGICLLGARNCKITNNTISRNPRKINQFESEPWIMIGPHKNGTPGQGNIVKNNLVPKLELSKKGGSSSENNSVIDNSFTLFYKDPLDWDFRLKDGCSAINTGNENGAPSEDILGHHRPQGKAIDAGCYEKEEK